MRVCVTGSTGFLGRALVRRLLAHGCRVRVLARPSHRAAELQAAGAELIAGDVRDRHAVARAVQESDVVYHLAAKLATTGRKNDFFETNVGGTQAVLTASLEQRAQRVIYVSSLAVYGPAAPNQRIDENTPLDPLPESRDFYAHSKIVADRFALSFAQKTGLPLTIIRPGIVFGPGRPLPVALFGFSLGRLTVVFGSPESRIPLTYLENLVDAIQMAARPEAAPLEQFNIVDDDDLTLEAYHRTRTQVEKTRTLFFPGWPVLVAGPFAAALSRVFPLGGALSRYQIQRALENRCYATDRVRQEIGWTPNVPLEKAIRLSVRPRRPQPGD